MMIITLIEVTMGTYLAFYPTTHTYTIEDGNLGNTNKLTNEIIEQQFLTLTIKGLAP